MDSKFQKYLKEAPEKKLKYTYVEDGIYSHILISDYGEFSTFAKAKMFLAKNARERVKDFKAGMSELPKNAKEINVEPDSHFSVYYDGMYTGIELSPLSTDHKKFSSAKKEAKEFFNQRIFDWTDAWKRATSLKKEDVEKE